MTKPVNSCNCECLSEKQVAQLKQETALDMDKLAKQVDDGQVCINDLYSNDSDLIKTFAYSFGSYEFVDFPKIVNFDRAVTRLWLNLAGYDCLSQPERQKRSQISYANVLKARLQSSSCQEPTGAEIATLAKNSGDKVNLELLMTCALRGENSGAFNVLKKELNPEKLADTIFELIVKDKWIKGPPREWIEKYIADQLIAPLLKGNYDEVGSFFERHWNGQNYIVGDAIKEVLRQMPDPDLAAARLCETSSLTYGFIETYLPDQAVKIYNEDKNLGGLIRIAERFPFATMAFWERQLNVVLTVEPTIQALQYLDTVLKRGNRDGRLFTDVKADYDKRSRSISDFVSRGVAGFQGKWPENFVLGEHVARVVAPKLLPALLARVSDGRTIVLNVGTNMDTRFFSDLVAGDAPLTSDELNAFYSRFSPDTPFVFNPADEAQVKALHRIMEWSADRLMDEGGMQKRKDYAKAIVLGARQLCVGPLKHSSSCFEELELYSLQGLYNLVYPAPPAKKSDDAL